MDGAALDGLPTHEAFRGVSGRPALRGDPQEWTAGRRICCAPNAQRPLPRVGSSLDDAAEWQPNGQRRINREAAVANHRPGVLLVELPGVLLVGLPEVELPGFPVVPTLEPLVAP